MKFKRTVTLLKAEASSYLNFLKRNVDAAILANIDRTFFVLTDTVSSHVAGNGYLSSCKK